MKSFREALSEVRSLETHPLVKNARKAHKDGVWDGNVDKNGNPIVHINGKPHTVVVENLDEALVKVTDVEFNYRDQLPNSPKPSDLGAIANEWKQDRMALRDAIKKMGGLVTNTIAPTRGTKWVGTVTIGTRGDASKLDDKSIQKAVKNHGIEIHDNQFRESTETVNENYAQDLDLAQKNMARLAKLEKGQDKKDYEAVARALNQGNLGAVKKVIKGISTTEIQADILNVLVGYNDLIAKMYPKAMSGGKLKSGMTVNKMINEEELQEKLGFNGSYQRKSKFDGKEFDRKKELMQLKKIQKALEQADKLHADLQYPHTVDAVNGIWDHINEAYIGIQTYVDHINKGEYDGKIDMEEEMKSFNKFNEEQEQLMEVGPRGTNISVQVKGFRGNLQKFDQMALDSIGYNLGSLLDIDTDSAEVTYKGDIAIYTFDEDESGYSANDVKGMFREASKTAKDRTKYSQITAKNFEKFDSTDDFPGRDPIDEYYAEAHYKNMANGKGFVYGVKLV